MVKKIARVVIDNEAKKELKNAYKYIKKDSLTKTFRAALTNCINTELLIISRQDTYLSSGYATLK